MNKKIYKIIILVFAILSLNNIILLIRNYSYAYFEKNIKTGVKLKITTLDEMPSKSEPLIDKLKENLNLNNSITDTDGIIYISGDKTTINFNYVWYSGKLWRIVVIYPDGTMKMMTEDNMTSISYGEDIDYENSCVREFLNEDFKDTLYNKENIIVTNAKWNATMVEMGDYLKKIPETTMIEDSVGLLNIYEDSKIREKSTTYVFDLKESYLNDVTQVYWLITPIIWDRYGDRYVSTSAEPGYWEPNYNFSVKPAVILKSGLLVSGKGTYENPYQIDGDKTNGKIGEKINTRLSGEYVKVDNKVYRVVGIDKDNDGNNITKLTSVDYIRNENGAIMRKKISNGWISSVNDSSDSSWGHYLNNTWLTSELKNYITEGTYYLNIISSGASYKNAICQDTNTMDTTKDCLKTTNTWQGLVGLPRVGEMFSAQLENDYEKISSVLTITPSSSNRNYSIDNEGGVSSTESGSSRVSIYLKSNVIITGGDGMSPDTAYTLGLGK